MLLSASAARAETAAALTAHVRDALAAHRSDAEIAAEVRLAKLTDRLDDPMIETLEGAGPLTREALDAQRDTSALLPESPWTAPQAGPPPTAEEQSRILAAGRAIALQYTASLPNFLCSETVKRYEGKYGKQAKARDSFTLEVSFNGMSDRYRLRLVNGKPTTKSLYEIGGFRSSGDFGGLQHMVFDPLAAARFTWVGHARVAGRDAHVFAYYIDAEHSTYGLDFERFWKGARMVAAARGLVYLDAETNRVLRLRIEADDIPSKWPVKRTVSVLDYGYAEIGGKQYLLPRFADMRIYTKDGPFRNLLEFGDYRRFAGEATVSFDK